MTKFPSINIQGKRYDFAHLNSFVHTLSGQARDQQDLKVRVSFRSHVFSKNCEPGQIHDLLDEGGRARSFCADRYAASLGLPRVCERMLVENFLTWESADRAGISNMAVVGGPLKSGNHNVILYYLYPSAVPGIDVELPVISSYERLVNFDHIKKRSKVVQVVKACHFNNMRMPRK